MYSPSAIPGLLSGVAGYISDKFDKPPAQSLSIALQAYEESVSHGLPLSLLLAVIEQESGFDPLAKSPYGGVGLMQVVPRFHREKLGGQPEHALLSVATNLEIGSRILKEYLQLAGGNLQRALLKYSGGGRGYPAAIESKMQKYSQVLKASTAASTLVASARGAEGSGLTALLRPVDASCPSVRCALNRTPETVGGRFVC